MFCFYCGQNGCNSLKVKIAKSNYISVFATEVVNVLNKFYIMAGVIAKENFIHIGRKQEKWKMQSAATWMRKSILWPMAWTCCKSNMKLQVWLLLIRDPSPFLLSVFFITNDFWCNKPENLHFNSHETNKG